MPPDNHSTDSLLSQGSADPPPLTQITVSPAAPLPQIDNIPSPTRTAQESEPESPDKAKPRRPFDLARFAYVQPTRTASGSTLTPGSRATSRSGSVASLPAVLARSTSTFSIAGSANAVPTSAIPPPGQKPKGKPGRKPQPPFSFSIPDRELARLRRCVGCNFPWTARKTVAQKMKHVRACAKKEGLTDEIVHILIRQELEKTPVEAIEIGTNKGKQKETEPEEPRTLLEGVIHGGETTRRRRRRGPTEGTLRELKDTRESILERARILLSSKEMGSGRADDAAPPPLTQPFAESALARRFQSTRAPLPLDSTQVYIPSPPHACERDRQHPPRTPPFGESALAKRFGNLETPLLSVDRERSSDIDLLWLDAEDESARAKLVSLDTLGRTQHKEEHECPVSNVTNTPNPNLVSIHVFWKFFE